MAAHEELFVEGNAVRVAFPGRAEERHVFPTPEEAHARAAIVREALSWVGTPFKNCSDIKGPKGGVDCAMLLVRCYVDTGRLPPFDPRPYPAAWHLHQDRQRFLEWIEQELGGVEVEQPRLGDCLVYQFGRCFSHGAILINSTEIVHAFYKGDICQVSWLEETDLRWVAKGWLRPIKYFEVRAAQ